MALEMNIRDISKIKSNNVPIEEKLEIIKCSKPYITALPYDRRTNDPSKLNERLEAIDESIARLDKKIEEKGESIEYYGERVNQWIAENEQYEKNIARMNELDQEMKELEETLKPQFESEISEVIDEINGIIGDDGMPPIHFSGGISLSEYNKIEYYYTDLNRIFEMSENGGLLNQFDVDRLYGVARYLNNNDSVYGRDERFDDVSRKIRNIADKYKGENHPKVIARNEEYMELGGSQYNLERDIEENNYWIRTWSEVKDKAIKDQQSLMKERDDLLNEKDLTQAKYDQATS